MNNTKTTIFNDIIYIVGEQFGYTIKELTSYKKNGDISNIRHLIMYILREKYKFTFVEIAQLLHRKDHSTVIYAVNKIGSQLYVKDTVTTNYYNILKQGLRL